MTVKTRDKAIGILLLILTVSLFSTFEVTSKFLSPCLGPIQITFLRFFIGGLILLPFAIFKIKSKRINIKLEDWIKFSILGTVNIVISMGLIQWGLVFTNASVCAILFSINPLFVMIIARFMLNEKITVKRATGMVLGIMGVVILFTDSLANRTSTPFGLLLILLSSMCFAFYTVLGKRIINARIDTVIVTCFSFLIGSMGLIPVQWAMGIEIFPDVSEVLPFLLYMSVVVTGLAYVTYFEGLSRLEAGAGSMLYFAKPALASILASLVLHETVGVKLVIGIVIIGSGIFVAQGNNRGS